VGVTLQHVFRRAYSAFASASRLPWHVRRAARAIVACRTLEMGQHVRACPNGHVERVYFNSCRHRACPQCGRAKLAEWIEKRTKQLLPCDHYHVTFTVPSELHPLWHTNRRRMNSILFDCARDTLLELIADPKYLGARPGILATLHTWGRTLTFHPHIHAVVTGGGWDGSTWRPITNGYLLPVRVVRALFRGKMLAAIRAAVDAGALTLPSDRSPTLWSNVFRQLYEKRWSVNIQERYAHARGVLAYLGRYLRGGPISNHRLLSADDRSIRMRYTDHHDGKSKILELEPETFIRRVCWHVPEPGQHQVRLWGLYARAKTDELEEARAAIPPGPPAAAATAKGRVPAKWGRRHDTCPVCHEPLVFVAVLDVRARGREPPDAVAQ
jgi:hypothetical protein